MDPVSPDEAPEHGFGIDKLRVRFPSDATARHELQLEDVIARDGRGRAWRTKDHRHPAGWSLYVEHDVRAREATIEFNPSRVIHPRGWQVFSVHRCHQALALVLNYVNEESLERISAPPGSGRLLRVDVARDFDIDPTVGPASRFFEALRPLRRAYARHATDHWDPRGGQDGSGAFTGLTVGGKRDHVSLYAKKRVTLHDPDPRDEEGVPQPGNVWAGLVQEEDTEGPEVIRWEVRARTDWLKKPGLLTVADLTHEGVLDFALERWQWSRMGTPVTSSDWLLREIATTSRLLDDERLVFAGWLAARQHGVALPPPSRATLRRFEKVAATLGAPDDDLLPQTRKRGRNDRWTRLDFKEGKARKPTLVPRRPRSRSAKVD